MQQSQTTPGVGEDFTESFSCDPSGAETFQNKYCPFPLNNQATTSQEEGLSRKAQRREEETNL